MIEITSTMDKTAYFRAYIQIYLKTLFRALIAVGCLAAVFVVTFSIDYGVNGKTAHWGITGSLLWLTLVAALAVALYAAFLPLAALVQSRSLLKKNAALTEPILWRADAKELRRQMADGEKSTYGWTELKPYRTVRDFVIYRMQTTKEYVILPRAAWTDEALGACTEWKKQADEANFYANNPVSAEQARRRAEQQEQGGTNEPMPQEQATEQGENDGEQKEEKDQDCTA